MLNHFRTLLLNRTADTTDPHIPEGFVAKGLTPVLAKLWSILFSGNDYRNGALAHSYLNLVHAAGMSEEITSYDPRLTYDVSLPRYFDFQQISNPEFSDFNFPIFVTGEFTNGYLNNSTSDTFVVTQVGTSSYIRVFSRGTGKYISESAFHNDPTEAEIGLTFTNDSSQEIQLFQTGLSFRISKNSGIAFNTTPGKSWLFSAKGSLELELENRIDMFTSADTLDLFKLLNNPASLLFLNEAQDTQIKVKRFALLLCAFVAALNDL